MKTGRKTWGYVEGYYGRLLTWEERQGLLDHVGDIGGNAYLYGPKEDTLHRRDWRIPYPSAWRKRFAALAARGRRRGVDLVPALAPGLSYRYLEAADYKTLLAKFRAFRSLGCRTLALLMDDIPARLPEDCAGAFRSLGEAHGLLLRKLRDDLSADGAPLTLWFCPTVYTDQFASGPVAGDPYLLDLAACIPKDIPVLWTGPRIISTSLGRKDIGALRKMFPGGLLLWDNLYANDYCPNKIFLGPYLGRTRETWEVSDGILLNPTGLPATDRLLLDLLAASRKGRPAKAAWTSVLEAREIPLEFRAVARFLDSPFFRAAAADLAPRRLASARKALKALIWDWKGDFHREWYPYLFMLDADFKASGTGKDAPEEEWLRKRYPPLVARLLLGR